MSWFDDVPLKRKLTLVILSTCALVLLLACVVLAVFELIDFRRTTVRDATVLADVIGTNAQAAITFDDADGAQKLLQALQAEPHVVAARLYGKDGAPFADFARVGAVVDFPVAPGPDGGSFAGGLSLFRPVVLSGKRIGTIYLLVDSAGIYERLGLFAAISAMVLAGSLLLATVLSARLQRPISGPILALAGVAGSVAERKDYSLRAPAAGRDELGALTDAFNRMLAQIQAQDQAVREGEERVRTVLDSTLSAVVVTDAAGKITDWNARAESMFGRTRAEVLGQEAAAIILPPQHRESGRLALRPAEAGRLVELSALRRDGSEFPVEVSACALKPGTEVDACVFITDIAERKRSESRIQEQVVRLDLLNRITRAIGERLDLPSIFQVVVRSLEDNLALDFIGVCLWDAVANQLTVSNIGVRSEALALELALPVNSSFASDQNGLAKCIRGQLVYEPDVAQVAFPFPQRLAKGGLHALVAAPLLVESKVFGVLLVARRAAHSFSSADCEFLRQLSEHVALAAHQAQLYGALQSAYEELRQTQQAVMQQERLRALGQMASGIAHDINNAISPVSLYTESLLEGEPGLSQRARSYLETIKRAIEDVAHTVARMREFYRQREPQLTLAAVDLNQLVQQVMDLTRARWNDMPQQRGIMIATATELAEGLPSIMAVASEVREALINLVFNAVDALPEGGSLIVRTRLDDRHVQGNGSSPHRVCVEVVDSGVGMDEATRRRCLEPFFTTKGERGTGLGLAMVYGVMQRHNSDIEIESAVGKGTTMRLAFQAASAAPAPASSARSVIPTRLRLLVVDDDPLLLRSLRDTLEGDGHVVVTANLGQAGIDAFKQSLQTSERFAAVITDLGMPYVDGRKVATSIKTLSPTTPVIMLTGWGQRLIADGDVPAHVDRVLSKPPKLRDLRDTLAELCPAAAAK